MDVFKKKTFIAGIIGTPPAGDYKIPEKCMKLRKVGPQLGGVPCVPPIYANAKI